MSPTRQMIKAAVDALSTEKIAVVPVQGGQIPPPQGNVSPPLPPGGDPNMAAPPGAPGAPPGMDPSMMGPPPGMPPMDPAMMGPPPGGAPPMDPAMMGPPPGEPPPGDAGMPPEGGEEEAANAQNEEVAQQSGDVMVPLNAMTHFATKIIEATKGKRTADPKDPNSAVPGGEAAPGQGPLPGMDPSISNIGGAPSDQGMALPGMAPAGAPPKTGSDNVEALQAIVERIALKRGHH